MAHLAAPLLPHLRRRRIVVTVALGLAVLALLRWRIFGDIVPNTYWAKSGGTPRHYALGLSYLGELVRDFPLIVGAPLALVLPATRRLTTYVLLVAGAWFAFFLRSGGDTFHYSRLAVPLVPVLSLLAVVGAVGCSQRLVARVPATYGTVTQGSVVAALLAGLLLIGLGNNHRRALPLSHGFDNVRRWTRVGQYLARNHRGKTLATVPIGAIGYFSKLPVIDLVGLTEPAIAKAGRSVPPELLTRDWIAHERHNTEWVLRRRPDLIITTKWRAEPWRDLSEARAGFLADWLLLREIKSSRSDKAGQAPYDLLDAPIAPDIHWLMFQRRQPQPQAQ
ncbi:MAG: hypothetical protein IPL40_16535 [Proteobacteria bacterium]|nr:hypothetical protein [Pseudomonadota bacterium]